MLHPENNIIAQIIAGGVGGAVKNGYNISLKNVHRCLLVCIIEQGADATQTTISPKQSSSGAGTAVGTDEKALTNNVNIYYNENCVTSNLLTKGTAAKTYQTDVNVSRTKMVIFDIVPAECMDIANGYDVLCVNTTDPAAANSLICIAILDPVRFAPLPTVFAD